MGVVVISDNLFINYAEGKLDIIAVQGKFLVHKQIERRDGLMFMRIKKRKYGN